MTKAKADRFLNQLKAYQAAPEVYKMREYLSALLGGIKDIRKFVIPYQPDAEKVIIIETKEQISPDLLGMDLSGETIRKEREKERR